MLPAAVLQSVTIGGGYGTGREIVEYFTRFGLVGGLRGLALVMISFSLLLGASYEVARVSRAYDYRRFFRQLLGSGWVAFEALYLAMFALVLAVILAATGDLFAQQLQSPRAAAIALMVGIVTLLAFYGRPWVLRVLALKAVLLSVVFAVYFTVVLSRSGAHIGVEVARGEVLAGWAGAALRYALYNSVVVPAMLFATSGIETRREAFFSGAISAVAALVPGVLLHLSFAAGYPQVLQEPLPAYWMITRLGLPALTIAYSVVLFGCLLDTGLCFIHSVNERLDGWRNETGRAVISGTARATTAVVCILVSGGLSFFGVIDLIARGYGTMAWGFLFLYVGPLLTVGMHRIFSAPAGVRPPPSEHHIKASV